MPTLPRFPADDILVHRNRKAIGAIHAKVAQKEYQIAILGYFSRNLVDEDGHVP